MTQKDSSTRTLVRHVVITGMGRSGTVFLSHLLNQAHNAVARHEELSDKHFMSLSYYRPDHPYVSHRISERAAALQREHPQSELFVHVDSGMCYAVDACEHVLGAKIFHLVRDGRRVVQSMYPRKIYTRREYTLPIIPDGADALRWDDWPRFEKLCWYWRDAVERLLERQVPVIRFEDVISNYDTVREKLLEPTGITLSRKQVEAAAAQPLNATRFRLKSLLPTRNAPLVWNSDYERRFRSMCAPTMEALGYELD